ncbi:PD-(D/E)XK nuclease family transposase [Methanobrevibacter cuticularis]|uniref:PD-(D/E)XK nuclease family transposase n=1 Tax=Methanobrevibacter cuticularis TaxID=47311 RepID=A0A166EEK1_9EURY|nr:Rpn family recombination-promoting nuclease/putative transposase [Methanobrevibacter cuticularis]KZX16564.1 PD-(D/E)XK nuclease family transposase [Methanobrevibacter cuticularis]
MKNKKLREIKNKLSLDNYNSLNDFIFFKYLCEKGNEKQQRTFLEALGIIIKDDFKIKNQKIAPEIIGNKTCILDFIAEDGNNTIINIELQLQNTKDFKNRLIYYLCRLMIDSLNKGENYNKIKKIIVIAIVNFNMNKSPYYHNVYRLINEKDKINDKFTFKLEIHIIELKKFREIKKDLTNKEHLYLTFIDNETTHNKRKELVKMDEGLKAAIEKIEEAVQDREALRVYHLIEMERMKIENQIEEGMEKGKKEGIIEVATNFKKIGISIEDIAKATGLSKDTIEKL